MPLAARSTIPRPTVQQRAGRRARQISPQRPPRSAHREIGRRPRAASEPSRTGSQRGGPPAARPPGSSRRRASCCGSPAGRSPSARSAGPNVPNRGDRRPTGLVVAPPAGHPAAETQVEVLDPAREVDRVVTAERQELPAIDGQHRPGRRRQVGLVDDALEAGHPAHALDQAEPRPDPRPHPLVLPARRTSSRGGREQGVVVVLEDAEQRGRRHPGRA